MMGMLLHLFFKIYFLEVANEGMEYLGLIKLFTSCHNNAENTSWTQM